MCDLIYRQQAIDALENTKTAISENGERYIAKQNAIMRIDALPSAQPTFDARDTQYNLPIGTDCISRQAIDKFIDGLEEIFADLRERHVDDSVCGLCEYDGAYIGQSGDWCNECPGFDKDDCFKLSDKTRKEWTEEIIKALPPAQPEPCEDAVSREEVLNCLEWQYPDKLPRTKIMELPHVIPKQRTGKWIKLDMHRGMADHKCTACEQECYVPTCMGEPMYAFCPNCGSYNGGEQDDSF